MWENPSKYQAWQTVRKTGGRTEGGDVGRALDFIFLIRWALGEVGGRMVVGLYRRREVCMYVHPILLW